MAKFPVISGDCDDSTPRSEPGAPISRRSSGTCTAPRIFVLVKYGQDCRSVRGSKVCHVGSPMGRGLPEVRSGWGSKVRLRTDARIWARDPCSASGFRAGAVGGASRSCRAPDRLAKHEDNNPTRTSEPDNGIWCESEFRAPVFGKGLRTHVPDSWACHRRTTMIDLPKSPPMYSRLSSKSRAHLGGNVLPISVKSAKIVAISRLEAWPSGDLSIISRHSSTFVDGGYCSGAEFRA